MFSLPKHVELFKAQLPIDVDSCLVQIREYASFAMYAEQQQRADLLYDAENILTHLRYRYIILSSATDAESQAFKLLYECELPEMIYQKSAPVVTFGDFESPIYEGIEEYLDEGLPDEVNDTDYSLPPQDSIVPYIHEEGLTALEIERPNVQTAIQEIVSCDSALALELSKHVVEPPAGIRIQNAPIESCISCLSEHHVGPLVLGSDYQASMCFNDYKIDAYHSRVGREDNPHILSESCSALKHNLRIGDPLFVKHDCRRVAVGLYLQTGDSIYCGKDYVLRKRKSLKENSLQRLALSQHLKSFITRVVG